MFLLVWLFVTRITRKVTDGFEINGRQRCLLVQTKADWILVVKGQRWRSLKGQNAFFIHYFVTICSWFSPQSPHFLFNCPSSLRSSDSTLSQLQSITSINSSPQVTWPTFCLWTLDLSGRSLQRLLPHSEPGLCSPTNQASWLSPVWTREHCK